MDKNHNQHENNNSNAYAKTKLKRKKPLSPKTLLIVILIVVGFGSSGFLYYKYNSLKDSTSQSIKQKEDLSKNIVEKLKKIILIESPEKPYIAAINDVEKIKSQTPTNAEFYKNAKNDDFLIVYPDRAYIYRESENKIINFAPIVKDSVEQSKPKDGVTPTP